MLSFNVLAEVTLSNGVIHNTGASADADLTFAITLPEDAPSLNIFVQGKTGDADLALIEVNDATFDCEVEKQGSNEACVIRNPKAGTYKFELTVYEAFDDAIVYASTQVYAQTHSCDELLNTTRVNIQNPLINEQQRSQICETLKQTENRFHELLGTNLVPVPNDQNAQVNVNIFANQAAYMTTGQFEQNMQDSASTGIYFESAPETEYAQANVNTFEAQRWAEAEFYIWELGHEYVHYLDGRYNKQGSYSTTEAHDITWWSEGLAEYIADHASPYMNVELVHSPINFNANEIVHSGYDGDASPYDWGSLLVRFLVEEKQQDLASLRQLMQEGEYNEMDVWLNTWSKETQSDFETWQSTQLLSDFTQRAQKLDIGETIQTTSQHGMLYYVDMEEGQELTISTMLGGGNVDIYLAFDEIPNKYDGAYFYCRSNFSTLDEMCSIESTQSGRYYILLDAPGYAIFVNTQLTASEQYTESEYAYSLCTTEVPYMGRNTNANTQVELINDSSETVQIYWLNNSSGSRSANSYASLASGETWQATWVVGDTFVVTDADNNCLATHVLASANNDLSFDGSSIEQSASSEPTAPETTEPEASSSGGSVPLSMLLIMLLGASRRFK